MEGGVPPAFTHCFLPSFVLITLGSRPCSYGFLELVSVLGGEPVLVTVPRLTAVQERAWTPPRPEGPLSFSNRLHSRAVSCSCRVAAYQRCHSEKVGWHLQALIFLPVIPGADPGTSDWKPLLGRPHLAFPREVAAAAADAGGHGDPQDSSCSPGACLPRPGAAWVELVSHRCVRGILALGELRRTFLVTPQNPTGDAATPVQPGSPGVNHTSTHSQAMQTSWPQCLQASLDPDQQARYKSLTSSSHCPYLSQGSVQSPTHPWGGAESDWG